LGDASSLGVFWVVLAEVALDRLHASNTVKNVPDVAVVRIQVVVAVGVAAGATSHIAVLSVLLKVKQSLVSFSLPKAGDGKSGPDVISRAFFLDAVISTSRSTGGPGADFRIELLV
jgi:hypothetical protein